MVALGQQPQHRRVVLDADLSQPSVAQGDDGGGAGVVAIGLVAVVVVQQPHPGGQFWWHVDHLLAGRDELLGEQRPGPGGTLDSPPPRRELARPVQQSLSLLAVGGQLQHRLHPLLVVEHRSGVRTAVRVDPDHVHGSSSSWVVCHGEQT